MEDSVWQSADGRCAAALRCVFPWLRARELWRCAGVCRAWRAVALDDALWRRALRPHAPPAVLRAFAAAAVTDRQGNSLKWSWRREFMLSTMRWERRARLETRGPLVHAALEPATRRLALLTEDASISIWEDRGEGWQESWSGSVVARGWRRAETARWAAGGGRLLLAGPLALSDRWELAVLQLDEEGAWRVVCRADAGAGGAACWAGTAAFLAPRLQALAPGLALTTVWLNTVSQEARSEYSGVTTPILRIFNESAAHISHIVMTEMPSVPIDVPEDGDLNEDEEYGPRAEYYLAISATKVSEENADRIIIAAMGDVRGPRGEAHALGAWRVRADALRPPPLLAGAGLAERVRRRRLERALPEREESPPPEEAAVRALCTAPDDVCSLGAQVLGLVVHPRGSCVWASTARGATCVTLPTLRRVLRVPLPRAAPPAAPPHYVSPDVDDDFFVTPEGSGSGVVVAVAARSGRRGAALRHAAPALAALLPRPAPPPPPAALLVLATDAIHVWEGTPLNL